MKVRSIKNRFVPRCHDVQLFMNQVTRQFNKHLRTMRARAYKDHLIEQACRDYINLYLE